jgi:hypothetical protein
MSVSLEHLSQATRDADLGAVISAWSELKIYLDRRSKELSEEVRNYPTPIARCDEQLTKLIEQRAVAIDQLKCLLEAAPARSGRLGRRRLAALQACPARPQAFPGDEFEIALRSRLKAALSGLRGSV